MEVTFFHSKIDLSLEWIVKLRFRSLPVPVLFEYYTKELGLEVTLNFSGASKQFKPILYDFLPCPIDIDIQSDIKDDT